MTDWLERLRARLRSGEAVVAGCLSGTSGDGIDVALTRFDRGGDGTNAAPRMLAFRTSPFPPALAPRVRDVLDGGPAGPGDLAVLARDLGLAFGAAVRALARERGLALDLVGSHGQTVWHHDGDPGRGRATLQLGEGAFVAAASGAPVVSDFRQADLAAGGEGAPLSALADGQLFEGLERPAALLNLGGMANLTLLGAGPDGGDLAFDTGPAGSLLDGLARRVLGRPFDEGGAAAAGGTPHAALLAELASHPYFAAPPPKSTGRDTFGEAWVDEVRARAAALGVRRPADLLRSAVELVALSIADALERFVLRRPGHLVVAGGGLRNGTLARALEERTGLAVVQSSVHGVDPDAREALVFAVFAVRAVLGRPSTAPWATGARGGAVLGAIHPPPAPEPPRPASRGS